MTKTSALSASEDSETYCEVSEDEEEKDDVLEKTKDLHVDLDESPLWSLSSRRRRTNTLSTPCQ